MKRLHISIVIQLFSLLGLTLFLPNALLAGSENTRVQAPEIFSSVWQIPKLYTQPENTFLQSFAIIGRYHGQYWYAESEGNSSQSWENRRFYFGFTGKFLQQFTLELQVTISEDFEPLVESLYDGFVKWQSRDYDLAISLGRLDYVYTGLERSTSSKRIKTMERNLLVNQIMPDEVVGVYVEGQEGGIGYQVDYSAAV